jgi:hypothetical protein
MFADIAYADESRYMAHPGRGESELAYIFFDSSPSNTT